MLRAFGDLGLDWRDGSRGDCATCGAHWLFPGMCLRQGGLSCPLGKGLNLGDLSSWDAGMEVAGRLAWGSLPLVRAGGSSSQGTPPHPSRDSLGSAAHAPGWPGRRWCTPLFL